ncbi:MAG: hypothetical protein AAF823_09685 [Planctomycetota bacterium]
MGRAWSQPFHTESMEALAKQLLFAPPETRVREVEAAEQLHDEVEAERTYPLSFVVFRVTATRRPSSKSEVLIVGASVAHDLRLLIDRLSRSVDMPEPSGGWVTPRDMAAERGISLKTVTRWRAEGLRWRWMPMGPKRARRVAICHEAIAHYEARGGAERVQRAESFSRMSPAQRERVVIEARALAMRSGATLNQVATKIAEQEGRSLEAIRQTLQAYDRSGEGPKLFPRYRGPIDRRQRRVIARAHRVGVSAERIAERYRRSVSTVYRVVREEQARVLRERRIEWVEVSVFDREDAESVIRRRAFKADEHLAAPPVEPEAAHELPTWLALACRQPALAEATARTLLIRFNYLKRGAKRGLDTLPNRDPGRREIDDIQARLAEADAIRRLVYRCHLPRVLAVSRRQWLRDEPRHPHDLLGWLAAGVAVLDEAIETHNPARVQPFDGYLTNRLLQAFARRAAALADEPTTARRRDPAAVTPAERELRGRLGEVMPLRLAESSDAA